MLNRGSLKKEDNGTETHKNAYNLNKIEINKLTLLKDTCLRTFLSKPTQKSYRTINFIIMQIFNKKQWKSNLLQR
jgi:hypothetical protein